MAKKIRPGQSINGYTITEEINIGAMAIAYAAQGPRGEKVFFKQYKSPSVRKPWYHGFVAYQKKLKARIESTSVKNFTYEIIDFFEAKHGPVTFFEVFEFVDMGKNLENVLADVRKGLMTWEQRIILAKVMMSGIRILHQEKIVHCDLKPPNIQLFSDDSIVAGYRLKLIDMDFSIMEDEQAPWHGHENYVGSPNYFSPEHLRGQVPTAASDIFTCGLILHELLAGGHPYRSDDPNEYTASVLAYGLPVPTLEQPMPKGNEAQVAQLIYEALNPDPLARPTAKELLYALAGKSAGLPATAPGAVAAVPPGPVAPLATFPARPASSPAAATSPTISPPAPEAAPSSPEKPPPLGRPDFYDRKRRPDSMGEKLYLINDHGEIPIKIRTVIGQHVLRGFGDDTRFWHAHQFIVEPLDGVWFLTPNTEADNETILNGRAVTAPVQLVHGDQVGVGREAKGIVKLPFRVEIV